MWTGQLWPKGSGTEGRPIMIDKYGGEAKPVINGSGAAEDAVLLKNQEYWEIRNLEVTNTGTSPGVRRGVRVMAVDYGDAHHIYVQGLDVHDVNGSNADERERRNHLSLRRGQEAEPLCGSAYRGQSYPPR